MITSKLNKIILILSLFALTQCYKAPFFELSVQVLDQEFNAVPNCSIVIEITDVDNGNVITKEIIEETFVSSTDGSGVAEFSFENKAFVSARACFLSNDSLLTIAACNDGHIYLEENDKKTLTLMIVPGDCSYCF